MPISLLQENDRSYFIFQKSFSYNMSSYYLNCQRQNLPIDITMIQNIAINVATGL